MATQIPDALHPDTVDILQIPQEVLSLQQELQPLTLSPESVAPQPECPLLQLPSEIRNQIYKFALLDDPLVEIRKTYRTPTLLNTCRQIRTEAGGLYYGTATFLLRAERGSEHKFVHRHPSGLCVLWLATRAFRASRLVERICLDLYTPRSLTTGWLEVWKPIALQIVKDRILRLQLGDGIRVSSWVEDEDLK